MAKQNKEVEGEFVALSMRMPIDLLATVDAVATDEGRTRSNMIRRLIESALKTRKESGLD